MDEEISKHDRKEIRQQQREEEKKNIEHETKSKANTKKAIKYTVLTIIILLAVFGMYKLVNNIKSNQPYYKGTFHWHANFAVSICGEEQQIRCGSNLCGIMLTHHHNDNIIHTEGQVIMEKEEVSLGKFFDRIGIPFTETQLMDKKNGDLCDGKPGKVKLVVDGKENTELRNYIPSKCDIQDPSEIRQRCDKIEVRFE